MLSSLKIAEYPVHQLILLGRGRLEIHIALLESSLNLIALLSLVYPYFRLEIEQDELRPGALFPRPPPPFTGVFLCLDDRAPLYLKVWISH